VPAAAAFPASAAFAPAPTGAAARFAVLRVVFFARADGLARLEGFALDRLEAFALDRLEGFALDRLEGFALVEAFELLPLVGERRRVEVLVAWAILFLGLPLVVAG
jgi:hypothetical protein